jgi:hypothetical protein
MAWAIFTKPAITMPMAFMTPKKENPGALALLRSGMPKEIFLGPSFIRTVFLRGLPI